MNGARKVVGLLTAAWLCCQIATPMIAFAIFPALTNGGAAASLLQCQCPHPAETGICPMHKTATGMTQCRLRRADDRTGAAFVGLSSFLGLTPVSTAVPVPSRASACVLAMTVIPLDRTVLPDLPPPRV